MPSTLIDQNARQLLLTAEQHNRIITLCGAHPDLVDLLKEAPVHSPATEEELTAARERHCYGSDDEIEVDDSAGTSHGDDGYFVQAWVWVPHAGD